VAHNGAIRWGILGTANIARFAFLPALHAAGGGRASAVAGRDAGRTEEFAHLNGVDHAVHGYDALLADDALDAVYIPLPNALHREWSIAALRAGKTVLCEKPLATTSSGATAVLDAARNSGGLLWEAFVYPFHDQTDRLNELLDEGAIGDPREVHVIWHFKLGSRENVRLSPELEGGALNDIGCYAISLARLVFRAEAGAGMALPVMAPEGVDEEMHGVLAFPGERRLLFSVGMRRGPFQSTTILGTDGEIRLTNPFHAGPNDTLEVRGRDDELVEQLAGDEPSFTDAIRHIHAVLRGEESPRHLAVDEAMGNATALDILQRSARTGSLEAV